MKKTDRIKELEKIAEKLGIGQNREVECVSCHKKIQFKDAILLTNKETVSHLCKECNEKLTKGELTKKQIDDNEILKEIERMRKEINIQPVPYIPQEPYTWKRIDKPYTIPCKTGDITYQVYTSSYVPETTMLLKLEPDHADRTSNRK